jgi:hypothetical protein
MKPVAYLIGENGNIFNLVAIASKALKQLNMYDSAKEMQNRVLSSNSYEEALSIIGDYVKIR